MKPIEFIAKVAPFAVSSMRETHVPASVTIAQAALESGWGEKAPGNNYFGIKGSGPAAQGLRHQIRAGQYRHGITPVPEGLQVFLTREYEGGVLVRIYDVFAAYPSPKESFDAHGRLLASRERYAQAFQATDGYGFARAVADAGYATDPQYYDKLALLIRKYSLLEYDRLARLP